MNPWHEKRHGGVVDERRAMIRNELTPLFQQYYELKDTQPGCLMLMRVGDFYEAYGEDADLLSRDAEIALTSKEAGGGLRLSMAGVPFFALEPYLRTLVEKGHRVAIADQMELASASKGLVRREVSRVITAGTVLDPQMLDEQRCNYLLCVRAGQEMLALAVCDITTGDLLCTEFHYSVEQNHIGLQRIGEEIYRFRPSEIVISGDSLVTGTIQSHLQEITNAPLVLREHAPKPEIVLHQFGWRDLKDTPLGQHEAATEAVSSLLQYLQETTRSQCLSLEHPRYYSVADHMVLDTTTLKNLELIETMMGRERKGSLLWAMDFTVTSMGARLLRQWMTRPLLDIDQIHQRSGTIAELVEDYYFCGLIRKALHPIKDIERLMARVVYQSANARDLASLLKSVEVLPSLVDLLAERSNITLRQIHTELQISPRLLSLLTRALADEPPHSLREGGMIRAGFHAGLDELREARSEAKNWLAALEERERELTGIRNLKVGFNQVFGYYLEITKSHQKSAPPHYIRKQTLANAERYFTPELKAIEDKVLGAEEKIRDLEYELFVQLREAVAQEAENLRLASRAVAQLDLYSSLAEAAVRNRWVRPHMTKEHVLHIEGGRHPVVERSVQSPFVPNDCRLNDQGRLVVLTGPNMSGKSTYLRQNALIVIMAQMGSFVPATQAELGIFDRVFTRVGASDDLHLGQSTFMVEMTESANILLNATSRSLVILDEIGRGTSTYDGLALAQSIAEYLYAHLKSKTLFATHFHELTKLAKERKGIINQRVAVQENRDQIVFLHRIVPGGADRSYGIYVGQLAGLPGPVLDRAQTLLAQLEKQGRHQGRAAAPTVQLSLFDAEEPPYEELLKKLLGNINPDDLSRQQAAEILAVLKDALPKQ
jgi:DNA mismatch repair protein MutS